jgi:hypothetical protein
MIEKLEKADYATERQKTFCNWAKEKEGNDEARAIQKEQHEAKIRQNLLWEPEILETNKIYHTVHQKFIPIHGGHSKSVYDSNYVNYTHMYDRLNESGDETLNSINTVDYAIKTSTLHDIANENSRLSKTLQVPDMYSRQLKAALEQHEKNMDKIAAALAAAFCFHYETFIEFASRIKIPFLTTSLSTI